MSVFQELVDLTTIPLDEEASFQPQAADEADDRFLLRLMERIALVPDATFFRLGNDAQRWFNNAATTINNYKTPEPPEGFVSNHQG